MVSFGVFLLSFVMEGRSKKPGDVALELLGLILCLIFVICWINSVPFYLCVKGFSSLEEVLRPLNKGFEILHRELIV